MINLYDYQNKFTSNQFYVKKYQKVIDNGKVYEKWGLKVSDVYCGYNFCRRVDSPDGNKLHPISYIQCYKQFFNFNNYKYDR